MDKVKDWDSKELGSNPHSATETKGGGAKRERLLKSVIDCPAYFECPFRVTITQKRVDAHTTD